MNMEVSFKYQTSIMHFLWPLLLWTHEVLTGQIRTMGGWGRVLFWILVAKITGAVGGKNCMLVTSTFIKEQKKTLINNNLKVCWLIAKWQAFTPCIHQNQQPCLLTGIKRHKWTLSLEGGLLPSTIQFHQVGILWDRTKSLFDSYPLTSRQLNSHKHSSFSLYKREGQSTMWWDWRTRLHTSRAVSVPLPTLLSPNRLGSEHKGALPVRGENVERGWCVANTVGFKDWNWKRVSVKELLVLSRGAFEGFPSVNALQRY